MMWSTIATFKENLSQIASDVLDTAEELEVGRGSGDRRALDGSSESRPQKPLLANGIDPNVKAELEWYKGEIRRLQTAEAEIQAMSVNYASILKEREEELSRLHEENEALKKTMAVATTEGDILPNGSAKRSVELSETSKARDNSSNGQEVLNEQTDLPPARQQRHANAFRAQNNQGIVRVHGKLAHSGMIANGTASPTEFEGRQQQMELKLRKLQEREKELTNLLRDETQRLMSLKVDHEASLAEIKELKEPLEKGRADLENANMQLKRKQDLNETAQNECSILKAENERMCAEMAELHKKLNGRNTEMNRLQAELRQRKEAHPNEYVEKLHNTISTLEKEKIELQTEKDGLLNALQGYQKGLPYMEVRKGSHATSDKQLRDGKQELSSSENLRSVEEACRLQKLEFEQSLKDVCKERDKALRDLARLKQHLLDKELEESEKMDQDSERIAELQAKSEARNARILQLEKSLSQALAYQEEIKKNNADELQKANEVICDLKKKLAGCVSALESKNLELLNLQTVLGQYYAESEAKDRVFGELTGAREEIAKLSEILKNANHSIAMKNKEKDEVLDKLAQAERRLLESQQITQRLEEEISRLRRALEQSMTRLNRMSLDSDYFVDRRIVIKLLVTYFQRQHSKEVLDLMVRMLGFSEEDKQRIGVAQQVVGKGVVRGVLGLPGRLVGGILGGGSSEAAPLVPSENQSFSDLWIDFLLKESEERERRENAEAQAKLGVSRQDQETASGDSRALTPSATINSASIRGGAPLKPTLGAREMVHSTGGFSNFSSTYSSAEQPLRGREAQWPNHVDTEFSTVPLNSAVSTTPESNLRYSRIMPRP
eukprot:Gb_09656 [translate_table: standard]